MSVERFSIPKNPFVASADERMEQLPPIVDALQGKTAEYLNKGMFFDVYTVDAPVVGEKQPQRYVVKDFRIGDAIMSPEERVSLVALQRVQNQDPLHVFSWDSLLSHNIMVETDAENRVTGRVCILDANALRRPTETHRKVVIRRNQNIIHTIRQALDI